MGMTGQREVRTGEFLQAGFQPLEVVLEFFQGVQDAPVGPQCFLLHDVVDGDQVADVEVGLVRGVVVGGIEVDDADLAFDGRHELFHAVAVGRLARAWRAYDQLAERHGATEARRKCSEVQRSAASVNDAKDVSSQAGGGDASAGGRARAERRGR